MSHRWTLLGAVLVAAVTYLTAGAEALGCGGFLCRHCCHKGAASARYAASPQYYVYQAPQGAGAAPQQMGISDVVAILGVLERLRPAPGNGGSGGSGGGMSSDVDKKFDELYKKLNQHDQEISTLVQSQTDVANKAQVKLDDHEKRIADLESKFEGLSTKVDAGFGEVLKAIKAGKQGTAKVATPEKVDPSAQKLQESKMLLKFKQDSQELLNKRLAELEKKGDQQSLSRLKTNKDQLAYEVDQLTARIDKMEKELKEGVKGKKK